MYNQISHDEVINLGGFKRHLSAHDAIRCYTMLYPKIPSISIMSEVAASRRGTSFIRIQSSLYFKLSDMLDKYYEMLDRSKKDSKINMYYWELVYRVVYAELKENFIIRKRSELRNIQ